MNGLEDYNSEETQANNLLGLNSELRHEVKESNHAKSNSFKMKKHSRQTIIM